MTADWRYAIEMKPDYSSLLELAGATRIYLRDHPTITQELAIEQPARIVVGLQTSKTPEIFYSRSRYDARSCNVAADPQTPLSVRNLGR